MFGDCIYFGGVVFGLTAVACRFTPSARLLDCWLDVAWVG